MIKYDLTKLSVRASSDKERARNCWFKIPIDRIKDLFEDEHFTGEICHLYQFCFASSSFCSLIHRLQ